MTLTDSLINDFLSDKVGASELPEPNWGPIGEDVYKRSYSRNIVEADGSTSPGWVWKVPEGRTTEVWGETVRRVVLGNLGYAPDTAEYDLEATQLFRMIYDFKIVPAGRHLWMTGVPGAALKNCHRAGWSKTTSDHFRFLASQLFLGGGVGSNYSAVYRERGQTVEGTIDVSITCSPEHADYEGVRAASDGLWTQESVGDTYKVQDTREGWVDAWVHLIDLAHTPGEHKITFDLSDIRPHGAPLKTFGGRASGPAPLAGSLVSVTRLLEKAEKGKHLSAIQTMDIDHYLASAIVAGGARRSARMSQLNWDDPEVMDFINHKGDDTNIWWTTNISVVVDENFQSALDAGDEHACNVLHSVARGMARNGEPGLYNLALAKVGEKRDVAATNPCGEAILEEHFDPETGEGSASGESCNLGSVDLDAIGTDQHDAMLAFELLGRFLYRATLAPIYDADQAEIEDRNRRLGVGLMGVQGWAAAHGVKLTELPEADELLSLLTHYRKQVRLSADRLAQTLGLPKPIKVTAIAPTGTIAQLRGTTSGMHPVYARYFVRRVQYSDHDPNLQDMIDKGFHVEDSVYAAHTKVVSIPVQDINVQSHDESLIEQADEVNVDQFLSVQAALQRTFCGGTDGQAISATANIPEGSDPKLIAEALRKHLPNIKGATVFPDESRPQQPITPISKGDWAIMMLELTQPDLVLTGDSNDGECAGGACPIR